MRERPILFSGPMVRAILEGRKMHTRRVVKPQPPSPEQVRARAGIDYSWIAPSSTRIQHHRPAGPVWAVRELMGREPVLRSPYGQPGDRLWVRESYFGNHFQHPNEPEGEREIHYRADGLPDFEGEEQFIRWRPSIHMPRWASRITLEVTGVRVERLQDISEDDAIAEGIEGFDQRTPGGDDAQDYWRDYLKADQRDESFPWVEGDPRASFRSLWESINGPASWDANPWVWVVEFQRIEQGADHA